MQPLLACYSLWWSELALAPPRTCDFVRSSFALHFVCLEKINSNCLLPKWFCAGCIFFNHTTVLLQCTCNYPFKPAHVQSLSWHSRMWPIWQVEMYSYHCTPHVQVLQRVVCSIRRTCPVMLILAGHHSVWIIEDISLASLEQLAIVGINPPQWHNRKGTLHCCLKVLIQCATVRVTHASVELLWNILSITSVSATYILCHWWFHSSMHKVW